MRRALLLAAAAVLYGVAAWSAKPGFYDCCAAPQYDYVSPPADLAPYNIQPTSGSGELQVLAGGTVAGGSVITRDQPVAQAGFRVNPGALAAPSNGGPVVLAIKPFAPHRYAATVLEGNVYCFTANTNFAQGGTATVTLLVPPTEPFPTAMYYSSSLDGPWTSLGGSVDMATFLMSATANSFGCFAVGYPPPKPGGGPTIRGSLLPLVVALLIVVVVLAGLPVALRRR